MLAERVHSQLSLAQLVLAGVLVPNKDVELTFTASGVGELAAVGSGNPADTGSFHIPTRHTFRGKAVAYVRPGSLSKAPTAGTIKLSASGAGLKGASTTITVS